VSEADPEVSGVPLVVFDALGAPGVFGLGAGRVGGLT
jgi:hypothetical protein